VTPEQIAAEHRQLARMRTHEMIAASKIESVPITDPQRASLQRKLREASSALRAAERAHAGRK
jgi:hypothetical protein